MRIDERQLAFSGKQSLGSLLSRILAFAGTILLMGLALMFSVMLFAVIAMAGLVAWGFFWWKTRKLRKQMRENPLFTQTFQQSASSEGVVLEGEVIREIRPDQGTGR